MSEFPRPVGNSETRSVTSNHSILSQIEVLTALYQVLYTHMYYNFDVAM
jgi:hypothetical protein